MNKHITYFSLVYFLMKACIVGIIFPLLIIEANENTWLIILLSTIFGFLPVFLIKFIASYSPDDLINKTKSLFPKLKYILIPFLFVLLLFMASLNFWNLCNLITSQFLNKTPKLIIGIIFLIPLFALTQKEEIIMVRVSFILFLLSLCILIVSILGLINQFQINHFLPYDHISFINPILSYLGYIILPLFFILLFNNKEVEKIIIKGYTITSILILGIISLIIGVLGIPFCKIYQYPEFHILKRAFASVLSYRLENFLASQWIFDIFIFTSICIYGCNKIINNNKISIINYLLLLILSVNLFPNDTIANAFINNIINIILFTSFAFLIMIYAIKIFIKKRIRQN